MRRLVLDTNLYIDWLNRGLHEDVLFRRDSVKYLSAVVLLELRAGAERPRDRRLLQRLEAGFDASRILTPSRLVYADAGDVLRRLRIGRGYQIDHARSIVNDVLIALSARSIGATVVTQNASDYRAIHAIRPFRLEVVTRAAPSPRS
jgi:predicted nucleic acid-binding protein